MATLTGNINNSNVRDTVIQFFNGTDTFIFPCTADSFTLSPPTVETVDIYHANEYSHSITGKDTQGRLSINMEKLALGSSGSNTIGLIALMDQLSSSLRFTQSLGAPSLQLEIQYPAPAGKVTGEVYRINRAYPVPGYQVNVASDRTTGTIEFTFHASDVQITDMA